jgi:glycosyltransferase involved in cell wall biosynthesis
VNQFLELARKMPDRKFLGVLPYYGELQVPPAPGNVEWVKFDDDIRNVLKRTRILLMPSYYESFGRIAVEAMLNGIPVIYSRPVASSAYSGGSTEGMHDWIQPTGIACSRDNIDEWMRAIESMDNSESYADISSRSKEHVDGMQMFTEAARITDMIESFSRQYPVVHAKQTTQQQQASQPSEPARLREPVGMRPGGLAFANGRLKIQR